VKKLRRGRVDDVAGEKSGMVVVIDRNQDVLKTNTIRMTVHAWGAEAERLRRAGVVDIGEQKKKS